MPRIRFDKTEITDGTDDTEGNTLKSHVTDGVENDDTDGNCFRGNVSDGVEDDDTEGNSFRGH